MGKRISSKKARQLALKILSDAEKRREQFAEEEAKKQSALSDEDYEFESEGC